MIKPDLLITWHESCDYPIHRMLLKRHRDRFGKIIVYLSKHFREPIYRDFLKTELMTLGNIEILDPIEYQYGVEDWRNVSTNHMLKYTNSEWVCSWEGDFFAKDFNKLFDAIEEASKTHDLLGYKGYQGQAEHQSPYLRGIYVHPAFWFMKRSALEKTNKNFSADTKQGCDHFGLITRDAQSLGISTWYTQDNGFPESDAFHQGGINNNYLEFGKITLHRAEDFYLYNYWSMKVQPQDPVFFEMCQRVGGIMKNDYPQINPIIDERRIFYE